MSNIKPRIFRRLIKLLPASWAEMKELADTAGCTAQTLYNWRTGKVSRPQLNKVESVAWALGFELDLIKR